MNIVTSVIAGLLELLSPERCVVCDTDRASRSWGRGVDGPAPGLHGWHTPHLCAACLERWRLPAMAGRAGDLPLWTALPESADLVRAVGAWKYRGVRGLARPLAALLVPLLGDLARDCPGIRLAPVPLHRRRRRERGFDQCHQLVALAGRAARVPVATDILTRRRATDQQASCAVDGGGRWLNVDDAFAARAPRPGEETALVLLDDLATTGATLSAAAAAAAARGWRVVALTALGQAGRLRRPGRG